jgi:hypothetical protein
MIPSQELSILKSKSPDTSETETPSLPEVQGAKIDRSSLTVGDGGVLVHYISSDVDFATATQAIIMVHGVHRDAFNAFASAQGAVEARNGSSVVIMAVRTLVVRYQKILIYNAYSLSSSMASIKARFRSPMGWLLPMNSCGKVSVRPRMKQC